ncbi:39kDa subunit of Ndufa9, NADH ubiquinone oxidoreductase [Heliocybe sulcata]|uniref:39kDa subunit of Ndufa9, NADH ubiquinone oxidoreductase n=1 Tax=Heliocybe sulcata TaxID=5364 RepID=A0A5C3N4G0_9AGAM|nr:39kDa subunit of Ndufa9, NADH ubiquinone oxidoreductase [Heliocybe sulcata]
MLSSRSHTLRVQRLLTQCQRRGLNDLVSSPSSHRPIASYGPPGRSAVSGHIATVFGCTGFLGRYLVAKLGCYGYSRPRIAKNGTQVVVPYRDQDEARHLKLMGDLGQVVHMEWDIRNDDQIAECLRHSDIVYNLVGRDYETKNFTYNDVNAAGAGRIAKVAAEWKVPRFVHVSHLNASHISDSKFYRTKMEGEDLVKEAFPHATIVRPSTMFGYEDKLLNNIAIWSIWWKLNHGETKIRPVHVMDVAQALANLEGMPALPKALNLPGPSTLSFNYLINLVASVTYNVEVGKGPVIPKRIAMVLAAAAQRVYWPTLTPDEVLRRFMDDSDVPGDWEKVGVVPEEIEAHALTYLRRYRSSDNFVRPLVLPNRDSSDVSLLPLL